LNMVMGAFGHTGDEMTAHGGDSGDLETPENYPTTYFTLQTNQFAIQAHIFFMVLSWVIILPIGNNLGSDVTF
jgi:hypothetical protein